MRKSSFDNTKYSSLPKVSVNLYEAEVPYGAEILSTILGRPEVVTITLISGIM